jgi:hypothetical protein
MRQRHTAHFGLRGIVKSVELIDIHTGMPKPINAAGDLKLGPFPNLIVDAALNGIGNGKPIDDMVEYLGVGTDNTAPAANQTALSSQVDDRYNSDGGFSDSNASGPANAYWSVTRTREIGPAFGNGNLTELGFFEDESGGTMWSRMLFLDGVGSPTTVVKSSNESLRVVYEWRVYLVLSPTSDVFDIDSVSTDCESRAIQGNDGDAWGGDGYAYFLGTWDEDSRRCRAYESNTFPAIDGGTFTGDSDLADSVDFLAYGSDDFYIDVDIVFEPGDANFTTGIGAIALPYCGSFIGGKHGLATTFDPKVDKDNTERFTFQGRVSWGRH